jgi:hypothetical protein
VAAVYDPAGHGVQAAAPAKGKSKALCRNLDRSAILKRDASIIFFNPTYLKTTFSSFDKTIKKDQNEILIYI